jgi:hypothetical protein
MSEVAVAGSRTAWRGRLGTELPPAVARFDARRALQLGLAAGWLLDGVLQYQPFLYTKAFGQSLAATAAGNPSIIARPITWDAILVQHHLELTNTIFATIQLLLGLGIAFRPTVRLALAASIAWSLVVWWFGEGLGGVLLALAYWPAKTAAAAVPATAPGLAPSAGVDGVDDVEGGPAR